MSVPVVSVERVARETFVLTFESESIARTARPGHFINIRVSDLPSPLLRRPFSISRVAGSRIEILFLRVGTGTGLLASKRPGDTLDVIGPLGNTFDYKTACGTAVLVAGGVGVAPMPFLTQHLRLGEIPVRTYIGARSKDFLVAAHCDNVSVATDDGTAGFHGTVVDLLRRDFGGRAPDGIRMYACGPTAMLRALSGFAAEEGFACEASLEGEMGCGIGLCQGCPVEMTGDEKKYRLVCHDGTVFPITSIRL